MGTSASGEIGLLAGLLGKDDRAELVASLFSAVRRCLAEATGVRAVREEPPRIANVATTKFTPPAVEALPNL